MSRYVDIAQLSQDVLDSVVREERTKTAAAPVEALHTDIGKALKVAADSIRSFDDTAVTEKDLADLVTRAQKTAFMSSMPSGHTVGGAMLGGALGGPLGALGGGLLGSRMGGGTPPPQPQPGPMGAPGGMPGMGGAVGGQPTPVQNPAADAAKTGSALGNELRKAAAEIRNRGTTNTEIRLTKAAQMLTAAVGLVHLTKGLQ